MLSWAARGQALADWYYWFDNDKAPRASGQMSDSNTQLQIDVSQLEEGAHMLYIQVVDIAGVSSTPTASLFCKVSQLSNISKFYYWLDSNTTATELPFGEGHFVVDVSTLSQGFHVINYCAMDSEGLMSDIKSSGFYRMPIESNQKLHYWFDGDSVATEVTDYKDSFVVDVTKAKEGFNTIYFQMEDNGPTDIQAYHFVKVPQTENAGDMTLICIIDGKVVGEEKVSAHGGVVKCDMDVSNMEVGLHRAMFQLITSSGAGSTLAETYFIRTLTNADIASMQCSYTIDGIIHGVQKGTCTNGTFHFDLPVDEIEVGLHRLDYHLVADNGASTSQGSDWFYKTPLGGNSIIRYDYWLNDKNDEVHSVAVEDPKDPFQLIKLLPVPAEPIRSSCFHFEVENNKPMVYAKNDIHFLFHDKSGRWAYNDKQYIDYNVSHEITNVANLMPSQTFARPEENEIKWFKFEAEEGDTIAFRCSLATSLQVFAPNGKEIYSASGDKSVQYGGVHTWENGTYYVAVHDVTGSQTDITLDCKEFEFSTSDKLGDVNQDGKVDVTDIAIIVSIINGNALSGYKADIDNDGDVDIDDLNKLIELILKK